MREDNLIMKYCRNCGAIYAEDRAVAFGLFSKTAKSQFRCGNCGYKW